MSTSQLFKVTASALNLRSTPKVEPSNHIAVLPEGQVVAKIAVAADDDWWKISTQLKGEDLEGFVAHRFLTSVTSNNPDQFDFPEPVDGDRIKKLTLWATFYNVHTAQSVSGGNPLLDPSGNRLGPELSDRDWCQAALEGTVAILGSDGRSTETYNFAGTGSTKQVDCSIFFPKLDPTVIQGTNRVRFQVSRGEFGEGTSGFILSPYRTVAVDRSFIPIGSVMFIPEARGQTVVLPSGASVIHDGYFFTADVGGAIKGNHIDVFLGISNKNPFAFIRSTSSSTFTAFLIRNAQVERTLKELHQG